jgi:hypothetical protein
LKASFISAMAFEISSLVRRVMVETMSLEIDEAYQGSPEKTDSGKREELFSPDPLEEP